MKQIYELSGSELSLVLENELARVQELKKPKETQKIEILLNMVERLEKEITLKVEGVRGNTNERQMVNTGSVIECLVKHHSKGYKELWKEFNDSKEDYKQGFLNVEIKASMPNARNTRLKEPKTVILINTKGAYLIKKNISLSVPTDSQGRYFENLDYSKFEGVRRIKSLSEKLGL